MQEYEELMGELIELAISANPVTPFACCIIDPCGQILITSANACHISPLYTDVGLALHKLTENFYLKPEQKLTLLSTAEPDCGGMSAILYGKCSGINITQIAYGLSRPKLKEIWSYDFSFRANEMISRLSESCESKPELIGSILENECYQAFEDGKSQHDQNECPVLSKDIDEFWLPGDWMLEIED